jgi:predicted metalloprotease with PDZ domain
MNLLAYIIILILSVSYECSSGVQKNDEGSLSLSIKHTTHQNDIAYRIKPVFEKGQIMLCMDMIFLDTASITTSVCFLPEPAWNQHEYLMETIESANPEIQILKGHNALWRVIQHEKRDTIHLRYTIKQDSNKLQEQNFTHPFPAIFTQDYFLLEFASLFLLPQPMVANLEESAKVRNISIIWDIDTLKWQYANRFGRNQQIQKINTSMNHFVRTVMIGSRSVVKCTISENIVSPEHSLFTVTSGIFIQYHSKFVDVLKNIFTEEYQSWRDTTSSNYVSVFIPVGIKTNEIVGFAIKDSFVVFLSDSLITLNQSAYSLIAHEMMHTWVSNEKIQSISQKKGFQYCVVEGFTDYFSRQVLKRAGLYNHEEYVLSLNTSLEKYYRSQHRHLSGDTITKYFWQDLEIMKIPYYQGDILAHNWNAEIIIHSRGKYTFVDAFRAMLKKKSQINEETFTQDLEPFIGRNVMPDIIQYMQMGRCPEPRHDAVPFAHLEFVEMQLAGGTKIQVPQYRIITSKE